MRKRKRDEELSADSATGASELRGVPTTPSKPTLKAATEIPEEGEVETVTDSEPPRPKMEVEGQTQTDGTTKPEEQEVQDQLCAGVSSVSLDKCEQDASGFLNGKRDGFVHASRASEEGTEVENSPLGSPMHVDREI